MNKKEIEIDIKALYSDQFGLDLMAAFSIALSVNDAPDCYWIELL